MDTKLALFGGDPVRTQLYPQHTTLIDDAEEREVIAVLRGGHLSGFSGRAGERFLGGPKVRELEDRFCDRFGVNYAVSFNSATSALHGAVMAAGIQAGDEVITSPFTMSATPSAVLMHNAIPVFADVEDRTFGLDPASVESRITPRTRAILTVNLFGHPSRLTALAAIADAHDIPLLEDNSQSPGAQCGRGLAGTFGKIGVQSLNYHKAIQTGEGGMALTDDPDVALRLQLIRNHGEAVVGDIGRHDEPSQLGWNYRLTEIQAAIGIPQLAKLDRLNQIRQRLASSLTAGLKEFDFLSPPVIEATCKHVYYLYAMRFDAKKVGIPRAAFAKALRAEGIAIAEGYTKPLYLLPMYQKRRAYGKNGFPFTLNADAAPDYSLGLCPVAERLYGREILTTDICKYPNSEREVEEFVTAVQKVIQNRDKLLSAA